MVEKSQKELANKTDGATVRAFIGDIEPRLRRMAASHVNCGTCQTRRAVRLAGTPLTMVCATCKPTKGAQRTIATTTTPWPPTGGVVDPEITRQHKRIDAALRGERLTPLPSAPARTAPSYNPDPLGYRTPKRVKSRH